MHRQRSAAKGVRLRFFIVSRAGRSYCCDLRLDADGVFSSFVLRRLPLRIATTASTGACADRRHGLEAPRSDWDSIEAPARLH